VDGDDVVCLGEMSTSSESRSGFAREDEDQVVDITGEDEEDVTVVEYSPGRSKGKYNCLFDKKEVKLFFTVFFSSAKKAFYNKCGWKRRAQVQPPARRCTLDKPFDKPSFFSIANKCVKEKSFCFSFFLVLF
jgi:hypothetical protein